MTRYIFKPRHIFQVMIYACVPSNFSYCKNKILPVDQFISTHSL